MTGLALAEVLEEHDWIAPRGYAWPCCVCGVEFPDGEDAAYAHVAAAVTAWLAERLASEEVQEAVRRKVTGFVCNVSNLPEPLQVPALGLNMTPVIDGATDAALAAVVGALTGES